MSPTSATPRRLRLRDGWAPSLAGLVVASVVTALVAGEQGEFAWLTSRVAVVALVLLAGGDLAGSTRLVGLATLPMLGAAVVAVDRAAGVAWGRTLVIGCLWYLAVELVWYGIELREEADRSPAISWQRGRELALVVVLALAAGVAGWLAATWAPDRTLLLRAAVIGLVLSALLTAARRLADPDGTGGRGTERARGPVSRPSG